jgi:transcriptional regulator with XRE-family HTH domain
MARLVEEERANLEIARIIRDLRKSAGLSQRALAERVGTTASAICRLEDSNYEGHSLSTLSRIAAALDRRIEIRFVSPRSTRANEVNRGRRQTTRSKRRAS